MTIEEMRALLAVEFQALLGPSCTYQEDVPGGITSQIWFTALAAPADDISDVDFVQTYAHPTAEALVATGADIGLTHYASCLVVIKPRGGRRGNPSTFYAYGRGW